MIKDGDKLVAELKLWVKLKELEKAVKEREKRARWLTYLHLTKDGR